MRCACLQEVDSIGDNATRFKAMAILRALYPQAWLVFVGGFSAKTLFFNSGIFDEFIDIKDIRGGGFGIFK